MGEEADPVPSLDPRYRLNFSQSLTSRTIRYMTWIAGNNTHQRASATIIFHHQDIPWIRRRYVLKMRYTHLSTHQHHIVFTMFARSSDPMYIAGGTMLSVVTSNSTLVNNVVFYTQERIRTNCVVSIPPRL